MMINSISNPKLIEDCLSLNVKLAQMKKEQKVLERYISILNDKERQFYNEIKVKNELIERNKKSYDQLLGMMVNNYRSHNELTFEQKINNLLAGFIYYMKECLGSPYRQWVDKSNNLFSYAELKSDTFPSINFIKEVGVTCASIPNLLFHWCKLEIPGKHLECAGGTYHWFKYLDSNKKLEKFDNNKKYPLGTLIVRKYKSKDDLGHIALLVTNINDVPMILHVYPKLDNDSGGSLCIEELNISNSWILDKDDKPDYYTHISLPGIWLT